jgi:membrane associated rhomboid family serine protease
LAYGFVFKAIENGEYWRFLWGAFFHSSVEHWLINSIVLVAIGTMASSLSRKYFIFIFYLGFLFTELVALIFFSFFDSESVGFVGISGGNFAVFGFVCLYLTQYQSRFPKKLYVTFYSYVFCMLTYDFVNSYLPTAIYHFLGFCLGSLLTFLVYKNHYLIQYFFEIKPLKSIE